MQLPEIGGVSGVPVTVAAFSFTGMLVAPGMPAGGRPRRPHHRLHAEDSDGR